MIELNISKRLHGNDGEYNLNLDFALEKGELLGVSGPSGAGKTTMLRMIAGLIQPDEGIIRVDGVTWFEAKPGNKRSKGVSQLKVRQRDLGMVFQDYALYPHMTVLENLQFAKDKSIPTERIHELVEAMELHSFVQVRADRLSGGQKQRVALARALVRNPRVLLLDEALSATDPAMRMKLQEFILNQHRQRGGYTIMVSHDVFELNRLANKVLHLPQGIFLPVPTMTQNEPSRITLPCVILSMTPTDHGVDLELNFGTQHYIHSITNKESLDLHIGQSYMLTTKVISSLESQPKPELT